MTVTEFQQALSSIEPPLLKVEIMSELIQREFPDDAPLRSQSGEDDQNIFTGSKGDWRWNGKKLYDCSRTEMQECIDWLAADHTAPTPVIGESDVQSDATGTVRSPDIGVIAALAAAISLLERTPKAKKAAPSDKMFDQMIADYKKALEEGRAALSSAQRVVDPPAPVSSRESIIRESADHD